MHQSAPYSSKAIIYIALGANLLVAATKFGAAAWTGSSAMFSEGIHSLADMGNEFLLLYGMHQSAARPDQDHPLGYGREVYFWSFAVALLVFALGAGIALYEGISHVSNPTPIENVSANYIVLGISALIDGSSWWITLKTFKGTTPYQNIFSEIHRSKDPPSFIILLEDSAALIGLLIAFIAIYLSVELDLPVLDGVASILLGLVLAATALLLARETKSLLIGERADQKIIDAILHAAGTIDGISHANGALAIHLAPNQILVALSMEFADNLHTSEIETRVTELERLVKLTFPSVVILFIKPQSQAAYRETIARRYGKADE
ncbi:cation diffusion facilitator family transporter [Undibacterium sp. Rencai35W]|uniref:cation diffusion facilitator family transporter n=1 Tax=Undibacterium sp. Rencai35W TaxID=3413046 RepID=UPI003BF0C157